MTKDLITLERDVKDMLRGGMSHPSLELNHSTAQRLISVSRNIALHTLDTVNHNPRPIKGMLDKTIRMSEIGEPCIRKLMYKWYWPSLGLPPEAEPSDPYLNVKFTFGDYIEELALFLAAEAGHEVKNRQAEVTLDVPGTDWKMVGHIDAVISGHVVDVKSAADTSFQKYRREGINPSNDMFGYLYQLDAYSMALENPQRAFLFVNKHDGHFHVDIKTLETYMPVEKKAWLIVDAAETLGQTGEPPKRRRPVPSPYGDRLDTVCSYCAFKMACWTDKSTGRLDIVKVIDKNRPVYLVKSTLTKEGIQLVEKKGVFFNVAAPEETPPEV